MNSDTDSSGLKSQGCSWDGIFIYLYMDIYIYIYTAFKCAVLERE